LDKLKNENEYYKGVTEDLLGKFGEEKDKVIIKVDVNGNVGNDGCS